MDFSLLPRGDDQEDTKRKTREQKLQNKFQSLCQDNLLRVRESTAAQKLNVVPTNEAEERQRYRHQWKSEDRQRFLQERLELVLAVITGLVLGFVTHDFLGRLSGCLTGLGIWFVTGLFRHWYGP